MAPRALGSAQSLWRNRIIYLNSHPKRDYAVATARSNRPPAQPTPAQLLQFAIAGNTRAQGEKKKHYPELDSELEGLYSNQYISKSQKAILLPPDQASLLLPERNDTTLSDILAVIEKQGKSRESVEELRRSISTSQKAFTQCHGRTQYEELLRAVNAITARFQAFDVPSPPELESLGLYYSSVCCSFTAFQHYVHRYSNRGFGHLPYERATGIIEQLISGLRSRVIADPALSRNKFLGPITGLNVNGVEIKDHGSLHSLLDLGPDNVEKPFVRQYVVLLGILGSTQRLLEIWNDIEARIRSNNTSGMRHTTVHCLQALIDSGEPERAVKAVKDISSFVDPNRIVPVRVWKGLFDHDSSGILQDVATEATKASVLQSELRPIEANLGITWIHESTQGNGEPDAGPHVSKDAQSNEVSNDLGPHLVGESTKAKHSLFAVADLMDGYGDHGDELGDVELGGQVDIGGRTTPGWTQLLLDATTANGSTGSLSSPATIADILNEYEGHGIPLGVGKDINQEFMWFPHCSPIEFAGNETPPGVDISAPWSAASLGLIRARPDCDGAPLNLGQHMHLMQLGYISSRDVGSVENGYGNDVQPWKNTGHIIGWDRLNERFVLLWVGKGHGTIPPGPLQPSPSRMLPYTSAEIGMSQSSGFSYLDINMVRPLDNAQTYWVDVDPAVDLLP